MDSLAARIMRMVADGTARASEHGLRELEEDGIKLLDIVSDMPKAVVIEQYPDYHKGPAVLFLVKDRDARPVHALWGVSKSTPDVVTLVTAYRPLPSRWSADFLRRVPK